MESQKIEPQSLIDAFPCPLCGDTQPIKLSKKNKPYFFCDTCGVQVFVRGKLGISRLIDLKADSNIQAAIKSLDIFRSSKLIQLRDRIQLIRGELERSASFNIIENENDEVSKLRAKLKDLQAQYLKLLK